MSRSRSICAIALFAALPLLAAAPPADKGPETISFKGAAGEVEFPHALHVDDLGIACVTCHHETAAEKLPAPHPDYFSGFWVNCATCHTGKPAAATSRNCASCHPPKPARGTDEMPSVKVAIHESCWKCHEETTGAQASATCSTCHQKSPSAGAPAGASGAE